MHRTGSQHCKPWRKMSGSEVVPTAVVHLSPQEYRNGSIGIAVVTASGSDR
jgi:hypothetical protein